MGHTPDQMDTVLTRLRASATHAAGDEIYTSNQKSGLLLVPTRTPTDELGRSALRHYCSDLETFTLRLNYLHGAPSVVNDETIRWVCSTMQRFKHESAYVSYAAEVLRKFCSPQLHEEVLVSRSSSKTLTCLTTAELQLRQYNALQTALHYCKILTDCNLVSLVSELATVSDFHDRALTQGVLAGIQALCVDPVNAKHLGGVPSLVETVFGMLQRNMQQDSSLLIDAVKTLGMLTCKDTIAKLLSCGCVPMFLSLLGRGGQSRVPVITAAAEAIAPLCDYYSSGMPFFFLPKNPLLGSNENHGRVNVGFCYLPKKPTLMLPVCLPQP